MCTVRCLIVDNKCEFQHSSSHYDCNFDARLARKKKGVRRAMRRGPDERSIHVVATLHTMSALIKRGCTSCNQSSWCQLPNVPLAIDCMINSASPPLSIIQQPCTGSCWEHNHAREGLWAKAKDQTVTSSYQNIYDFLTCSARTTTSKHTRDQKAREAKTEKKTCLQMRRFIHG